MYVKLFGTILQSSIWSEDPGTRLVWITLLTLADADGYVRSSTSGLARTANVSVQATKKALTVLASPDDDSGTQEYEGRRIEAVEGGWFLLNYKKYREIRTREQLANAERQRRYKERHAVSGNADNEELTQVTTTASASSSVVKPKKKDYTEDFNIWWKAYPKRSGNNPKSAALKLYNTRRNAGVSAVDLLEGATRYHRFCASAGNLKTKYILKAETWLDTDTEGWAQDWIADQTEMSKDEEDDLAYKASLI